MIAVAKVSQIDYERGMVKVTLPERNNAESNWIGMPANEYDMPKVGDAVMCSFDEGNLSTGVCHGKHFHNRNLPMESGETVYYLPMCGDLVVKYDSAEKTLEIIADTVKFSGDLEIAGNVDIAGDLAVGGNVNVAGTVMAAAVIEGGG